jgi:hypothetical protein
MTTAELIAAQRDVSVARGEAERPFKLQGQAIQAELDRRALTDRVEAALDGLTEAQRAQVLAELQSTSEE